MTSALNINRVTDLAEVKADKMEFSLINNPNKQVGTMEFAEILTVTTVAWFCVGIWKQYSELESWPHARNN